MFCQFCTCFVSHIHILPVMFMNYRLCTGSQLHACNVSYVHVVLVKCIYCQLCTYTVSNGHILPVMHVWSVMYMFCQIYTCTVSYVHVLSVTYMYSQLCICTVSYVPASVAELDAPSNWRPGGRGFNILSWRLIMKYFLRSLSPFR